jgi:hypothetical protein
MNNPDHIADQGSKIRDGKNSNPGWKKFGSATRGREMEMDYVHNAITGWQERKYFVINSVFRIQIGSDLHHFAGSGSVDIVSKQMKK